LSSAALSSRALRVPSRPSRVSLRARCRRLWEGPPWSRPHPDPLLRRRLRSPRSPPARPLYS